MRWRDDFANNRVHEVTGKVPALVFQHTEKAALNPLPATSFDTDQVEGQSVTKSFRVRFDRNTYSVPPTLLCQPVVVRADDDWVHIWLGTKEVARHQRCWATGEDIEAPEHREAALILKPGARRGGLPPVLERMGEVATQYFKVATAGTKSLYRERVRLVFFAEVFGPTQTADYVEYVLRQKKGLLPGAAPLKLGQPELDDASLPEPDMSRYDALGPNPDKAAPPTDTEESA
jgi:hypothetical protein